MGKILCSTRGGDASIRTQEAAIRRAKESKDELVFFYAFDLEFLAQADFVVRSDVVSEEMDKMAHFLMAMAVERAGKEGVEARYVIRHGRFADELKAAIAEEGATLVVLGRPVDEKSAFQLHGLEKLAESVQEETGVEVWIPLAELPKE
jgi:nucleotide-binding universal stress UspA family protein